MRVDLVIQAHRPLVVAAAAVVPLVACGVLALLGDSVANTTAALGLVLLVVVAASTGIRPAGIVAAFSSAAGFDYFLTEPYNTFNISDRADIETAVLLLLVGTAVTEVALWGRREQARASREQGYLDGVLGTAATVTNGQFLLTAATRVVRPSREQLRVAVTLANQVGAARANAGRAQPAEEPRAPANAPFGVGHDDEPAYRWRLKCATSHRR